MKYIVVVPFEIETPQGIITLPAGKVLELTPEQAARIGGKVQTVQAKTGIELDHYCQPSDSWCSEKLRGKNHPEGCARSKCEYHAEVTSC